MAHSPKRLLFVCSGNICRSPTAEAVARAVIRREGWESHLEVDSAGTHGFHQGETPDARAQAHGQKRGYGFAGQRARPVRPDDLERFHLILAMDGGHLSHLQRMAAQHPSATARLALLRADGGDVPDPYYGGADGFEQVLDLVEAETERWLRVALADD